MIDLCSHFGFHTLPFTREIAVDKRLEHPQFTDALTALERVVDHRMSAALIAPAGTGKTALLRALLHRLPAARYRTHYVKVTDLAKRDLCREIATAVGTAPAGSYPMLVRRLQEHFMTALDTDGLRCVMVLDEAHDVRPDVLGMIRILTNFEMDSRLVVSVILAGQPALRTLLRRDALVDVARRLAHVATLSPLGREDITHYVKHRANIAGATTFPFDARALDALFEIGRGNLRATDRLALTALEVAAEGEHEIVDGTHIAEARTRVIA